MAFEIHIKPIHILTCVFIHEYVYSMCFYLYMGMCMYIYIFWGIGRQGGMEWEKLRSKWREHECYVKCYVFKGKFYLH